MLISPISPIILSTVLVRYAGFRPWLFAKRLLGPKQPTDHKLKRWRQGEQNVVHIQWQWERLSDETSSVELFIDSLKRAEDPSASFTTTFLVSVSGLIENENLGMRHFPNPSLRPHRVAVSCFGFLLQRSKWVGRLFFHSYSLSPLEHLPQSLIPHMHPLGTTKNGALGVSLGSSSIYHS